MKHKNHSQLDLKPNENNGNIPTDFGEFCIKLSNIMNRNTKGVFLCVFVCWLVVILLLLLFVCLAFHTLKLCSGNVMKQQLLFPVTSSLVLQQHYLSGEIQSLK